MKIVVGNKVFFKSGERSIWLTEEGRRSPNLAIGYSVVGSVDNGMLWIRHVVKNNFAFFTKSACAYRP